MMTASLYLSRARLRSSRGEALSAIAPLLIPDTKSERAGHAHRILWLLFQKEPDMKRDFLWRDEGRGRFMILSRSQPTDPLGLFDLETKPFEPKLALGDRLAFVLRVNPVMATKKAGPPATRGARVRGKRVDVVMHALHGIPKGERALARDRIAAEAGAKWLATQGGAAGFRLVRKPIVDSYNQIAIERRKGRPAGIAVLELKGEIEITDPVAFLAKLPRGFGSAKAFGNGLMLIRRI
jgi:CRISPR system Cascade subunit CasE